MHFKNILGKGKKENYENMFFTETSSPKENTNVNVIPLSFLRLKNVLVAALNGRWART